MEIGFKLAFGTAFLGLVLGAIRVARRLRSRPEASVDQTEHELPALRIIRPVLGLVFYGALADWLIPGSRLPWATMELPLAVRGLGGILSLAGVGLVVWSFETLGSHYRGGVGLWEDHRLVTTGPYRRVRHPIYAGFVLLMAGILLLSANWVMGISGLALTVSIPALRVSVEERQLEERFGDRWRSYASRTGAFWPRR